ncbi:MAG: S8 family peptidase, partial [Gammaproteobacteria bacterium]
MNSSRWSIVIIASALAGCASVATRDSRNDGAMQAATRILVTIPHSGSSTQQQLGDPGSFYLRRRGYGPSPGVNRTLDRIADDYDLRRVDGWHIASIDQYCEVYEVRGQQSSAELIERISTDPRVELAQPMNYFETQGVLYDDPLANLQPALTTLAIHEAHEMATGQGITVAVIDSFVDRRHLEFRGRVLEQLDLVDSPGRTRGEIHGTAVAGVIGSAANNGTGIVGVAPDSAIASLRACWTVDDATGRAQCSSFSLAQALEFAIQLGVDVINLSLVGPEDPLLRELLHAATDNDIIVVSASPTDDQSDRNFPSSHSAVIAVASSNTSLGDDADNVLRAPGAEVMSTMPNNRYGFFSGHSM